MQLNMIPFNLDLLILSADQAKLLGQVKVLDTFVPSSRNFHPEGLFSTEIFGRIGDNQRNYQFGYIDLFADILHPLVYEVIDSLKGLYSEIMQSKTYAVWDSALKDFVKSTPTQGETGYSFFMQHINDIVYTKTQSDRRDFYIRLMDKYAGKNRMTRLLVMPAGFRDYEIDASGKPSEDEINSMYRKILSLSKLLEGTSKDFDNKIFDSIRSSIQTTVYELYTYIKSLIEGKHKLILGKWGSRRISNGTRNVIATVNNVTDTINSPLTSGFNDTLVGLYQFMKATLPFMVYHLRSGFLSEVFTGPNAPSNLVDRKTLQKVVVQVSPSEFDGWMTSEGIENKVNHYGEEDTRHLPVIIDNYYLGLVYEKDDNVMILHDIDDLPEPFSKKDVHPMTYTELFYFAAERYYRDLFAFFTRYPVTGYGSIYPSAIYLKTTMPSKPVHLLDSRGINTVRELIQFPVRGADFMNAMAPSSAHLARLGADHDGDQCSLNTVYSDEGTLEIRKLLGSRKYYVDVNGQMNFSAGNDALKYTLASMTG